MVSKDSIAIGVSRIGHDSQQIVSGTIEELIDTDFGTPLHSLVIPAQMHFLEGDVVEGFAVNKETFRKHAVISNH